MECTCMSLLTIYYTSITNLLSLLAKSPPSKKDAALMLSEGVCAAFAVASLPLDAVFLAGGFVEFKGDHS